MVHAHLHSHRLHVDCRGHRAVDSDAICGCRRRVRHHHPQRPHHRRYGFALVRGRYRREGWSHRRDRQPRRRACQADDRRPRPGRGAGIHRHAWSIGNHHAGRSACAVEDLPGHHHRDHRRRRIGGAARRRDDQATPGGVRALSDNAGLAHVRTIFRAPAKERHGYQRRHVRGRHFSARDGHWLRESRTHAGRVEEDAGAGRGSDEARCAGAVHGARRRLTPEPTS